MSEGEDGQDTCKTCSLRNVSNTWLGGCSRTSAESWSSRERESRKMHTGCSRIEFLAISCYSESRQDEEWRAATVSKQWRSTDDSNDSNDGKLHGLTQMWLSFTGMVFYVAINVPKYTIPLFKPRSPDDRMQMHAAAGSPRRFRHEAG